MTNRIIILLSTILLVSCHDCDFKIDKNVLRDFNSYDVGQIIYFQSDQGDLDTIKISGIDSYEVCHSFMVEDHKVLDLKIEHLPYNKWNFGNYFVEKPDSIVNQSLISIDKRGREVQNGYYKSMSYRDFSAEINIEFSEIEKIDTIKNISKNVGEIQKVYWSNRNGLVGYQMVDGEIYKLKNVP